MRIRFQADSDLRRAIVTGLLRREPGVDFRTAQSAGLEGLEDHAVLEQAAAQDRILVSHDFGSMPRHFAAFVESHDSPGVILISQRLPVREAIDWLLLLWAASDPQDWRNQVTYLPL